MSEKVVLITDHTWPSVEPERKVLADAGAQIMVAEQGSEEELVRLVHDADAILTCFAQVTPAVVMAGHKLQVIGRYGIGVDNIAVAEATRRGVLVTNVPDYCVDEVAEHTLALVLALTRKICTYDRSVREGEWSLAAGAPIHRLAGATLGIVGFGKIGQALATKARGLALRVLVCDSSAGSTAEIEAATLEQLARESDIVSLHLPLTETTRGLIGETFLRAMKPTAFLVNTSRGAIVDQEALLRALSEGWLAGAGIDVFVPERLPADPCFSPMPT